MGRREARMGMRGRMRKSHWSTEETGAWLGAVAVDVEIKR